MPPGRELRRLSTAKSRIRAASGVARLTIVIITSRSAAEYVGMFDLSSDDLAGAVLDCCAGGSSLAAESGGSVVAVDPAYAMDREELADSVLTALREGDRIIEAHLDRFEWDWYGDPARRAEMRTSAAHSFLVDLRRYPERYVAGSLPHLPIADASFDLALCSHMLFTWSNEFDDEWHRAALAEMVRVSREVRIFPLVVQGTGEPVRYLDDLRADLEEAGHRTAVTTVPYRFQRGADQMLLIETRRLAG